MALFASTATSPCTSTTVSSSRDHGKAIAGTTDDDMTDRPAGQPRKLAPDRDERFGHRVARIRFVTKDGHRQTRHGTDPPGDQRLERLEIAALGPPDERRVQSSLQSDLSQVQSPAGIAWFTRTYGRYSTPFDEGRPGRVGSAVPTRSR